MTVGSYRIDYDGTYTVLVYRDGISEADGVETFSTFSAAKAALVAYLSGMRNDWAFAAKHARSLKRDQVEEAGHDVPGTR